MSNKVPLLQRVPARPRKLPTEFPGVGSCGVHVGQNEWWLVVSNMLQKNDPCPHRTWYIGDHPNRASYFFWFCGGWKAQPGFFQEHVRSSLPSFLMQPLHRVPPSEWPWSKAPHPQDAICHTSWSEAPGALGWYLGGEALPFIGTNQAPYSTMIIYSHTAREICIYT